MQEVKCVLCGKSEKTHYPKEKWYCKTCLTRRPAYDIVCDNCNRSATIHYRPQAGEGKYCSTCWKVFKTPTKNCEREEHRSEQLPSPSKQKKEEEVVRTAVDQAKQESPILQYTVDLQAKQPVNEEVEFDFPSLDSIHTSIADLGIGSVEHLLDSTANQHLFDEVESKNHVKPDIFVPQEEKVVDLSESVNKPKVYIVTPKVPKDYMFLKDFGILGLEELHDSLDFTQILRVIKVYFRDRLKARQFPFEESKCKTLSWPWEEQADLTIMPKCRGLLGTNKLFTFVKRAGIIQLSCTSTTFEWKKKFDDFDLKTAGAIDSGNWVFLRHRLPKTDPIDKDGHFIVNFTQKTWWVFSTTVAVELDEKLLAKAKNGLLSRTRSKYTFQQMTEVARNAWIPNIVDEIFPAESFQIRRDHISAAWRFQSDIEAKTMYNTMLATYRDNESYNSSLANELPPISNYIGDWLQRFPCVRLPI